MSRGLGALQREIKRMLDLVNEQMRFADIRSAFIMMRGGDLEQDLTPAFERSLKRALKGLIDREDVLIVHGKGGPGDPRSYTTVECFASSTGEKVKDTAHAKPIIAELHDAVTKVRLGRVVEDGRCKASLQRNPYPITRNIIDIQGYFRQTRYLGGERLAGQFKHLLGQEADCSGFGGRSGGGFPGSSKHTHSFVGSFLPRIDQSADAIERFTVISSALFIGGNMWRLRSF